MAHQWLLWQLADSAFPSGSFAHSGGLEAAIQLGVVRDRASLEAFLATALRQVDSGVGRLMRRAWTAPEAFEVLDVECDLFLNNHIANRASRAQGQAFLASAGKTFALESLTALTKRVRADRSPGHLAPVFGVVTRAIDVDESDAIELFRFTTVRGFISSAVRLGIIGPMEAQRAQTQFVTRASGPCEQRGFNPATAPEHPTPARAGGPCHECAVQVSPVLDLIHATHDRLYSKLFQS